MPAARGGVWLSDRMVKQLAAALDLCAVFAAMLTCLTAPTRRAGWVLAALSALWPVLNNRVFEGPVLLTVDRRHGVTAADLIALAGYLLAAEVLVRDPSNPRLQPFLLELHARLAIPVRSRHCHRYHPSITNSPVIYHDRLHL